MDGEMECLASPKRNKAFYKRQEAFLKLLMKKEKPQTFNITRSGNRIGNHLEDEEENIMWDYEEAWTALDNAMDNNGAKWHQELRLKQQANINRKYDMARSDALFHSKNSVTSAGTKLLSDLTEESTGIRRIASEPELGYRRHYKSKDSKTLKTVLIDSGVNWVCPENSSNSGLNVPCMQLSSKSALGFMKPAELDNNFCIEADNIGFRREVIRQSIEDAEHNLHDELLYYYFEKSSGKVISPWHDLALICHNPPSHITKSHGLLVNMVVEIPRFKSAKMEISIDRVHNPIIQDRCKLNKNRFYAGPIPWNYGALPQTWEDPHHEGDGEVNNLMGDGDPLDVVDLSRNCSRELKVGECVPVRVLGCLPMLDGGSELDWKILAINVYDDHFDEIHDLYSLEKVYPHSLTGCREWFRWYKYNDGKPLNDFGYMGLVICRCGAEEIIASTHLMWRKLMTWTNKLALEVKDDDLNKDDDQKNLIRYNHTGLDLGPEFKYNVWVPSMLRPNTKSWFDRFVIWQGYLAVNAGCKKTANLEEKEVLDS